MSPQKPVRRSAGSHRWPLESPWAVALPLALASGALQRLPEAVDRLRYLPQAPLLDQPWRLLTGQLVHLSVAHWAANAAALVILAFLHAELRVSSAAFLAAWLASALAVGLGLWAWVPAVHWYVGMSGALHGLFAAAAIELLLQGPGRERRLGLILWAAGALKLAWEGASGWPIHATSWLGLPTVPAAHVFGYAGGSLWGAARRLLARRRAPGPAQGEDARPEQEQRTEID